MPVFNPPTLGNTRADSWVALTGAGGGGAPSYSAEATALFARFSTPATDPRKTLIDNLIVALKAAGSWAKYDAFYLPAAETAQAAQRNWVADAYNLSEVNAPTFTADRGYTPNGTTSYLDTSFNPTTAVAPKLTLNDGYMGAWHRTANLNGAGTSQDVGNTNSRMVRASTNNSIAANRATVVNAASAYAIDKAWSRTGATAWRYYESGALVGADPRVDGSSGFTNFNFSIGRISAIAFGVNQCSVFRFGSSLTTAEQAAEFTAIQTYMVAVGAA